MTDHSDGLAGSDDMPNHPTSDVPLGESATPEVLSSSAVPLTQESGASDPAAKRASNRLRYGLLALILVSVMGIASWGLLSSRASAPTVNPQAATPTTILDGAGTTPWGVQYNSAPGKPVLAVWEDFQCPYCAQLEQISGSGIRALADAGKISLVWRPTVFLDGNPASQSGPNPNSSVRSTMAWGCAIDAGKGAQYHERLFAQQPATEGTGWTDAQLLTFASDVGISGANLDTFKACYSSKKYESWVKNSYSAFESEGVAGTPAGYLNGVELTPDQLGNPTLLADLVSKATN